MSLKYQSINGESRWMLTTSTRYIEISRQQAIQVFNRKLYAVRKSLHG
ncbi:TPA: hypothetical protein ACX6QF_000083 [Photobacterium damselae]|nr:hypothetical protein [Photobacterium damselae]